MWLTELLKCADLTEKLKFLMQLILIKILQVILNLVLRKLSSMFRTTWVSEFNFSNVNFTNLSTEKVLLIKI